MKKIIKRDGRKVNFDESKIYNAIFDAFDSCEKGDKKIVETITDEVVANIDNEFKNSIPFVEDVQDAIEKILIAHNQADVAKAFILYRYNRTVARNARSEQNIKIGSLLNDTSSNLTYANLIKNLGKETVSSYFRNLIINPKVNNSIFNGDIAINNIFSYGLTFEDFEVDAKDLLKRRIIDLSKISLSRDLFYLIFIFIKGISKEISGTIYFKNFITLLDLGYFYDLSFVSNISTDLKDIFNLNSQISYLELNNSKEDVAKARKLFATSIEQFLYFFNDSDSGNYIKLFLDNEEKENETTNILIDTLKDNKELLYPEIVFTSNESILTNLLDLIKSGYHPFIKNAEYTAKPSSFTYFINFTHLLTQDVSVENIAKKFAEMLDLIKTSLNERLEIIKGKERTSFPQISRFLDNKFLSIDYFSSYFVSICPIGLYELMKCKEFNSSDLLKALKLEIDKHNINSIFKLELSAKYVPNVSSTFGIIDRKNNHLFSEKNFYSCGCYFPNFLEVSYEDKLDYESKFSTKNNISAFLILLKSEDLNINLFKKILKDYLKLGMLLFLLENENIDKNVFIGGRFDLFVANDTKNAKNQNLAELYSSKPLKL